MSRLVVVDAYNAAWRLFGDLDGDLDAARRRLVERARRASPGKAIPGGVHRIHLVFDTRPGAYREGLKGRSGRISWHYAIGSADEASKCSTPSVADWPLRRVRCHSSIPFMAWK